MTSIRPLLAALLATAALLTAAGTAAVAALWPRAAHPPTVAVAPLPPPDLAPCTTTRPCLAVVIDDLGRDRVALQALLALPAELTLAVLPHARHTAASVAAARAAGREVILHLPLAPLDGRRVTDELVVVGRERPLAAATTACLDRIPGAAGLNNHMGSALSVDPEALGEILDVIQARGLWVLDSRTTEHSVICDVARRRGVRCLERDQFLDAPPTPDGVRQAWARAVRVAQRRGFAVAIGHPIRSTITELRTLLARSEVRVVRLSRLVETGAGVSAAATGNGT